MLADFLGKGWGMPIRTEKGRIALSRGEESVYEAIWIILATAPGERVMRPDFGCGLHHLVFEVNESATLGRVAQQVRQALVRWEPRVDVLDIDVEVKDRGEVLLINIHYKIRSTNNFFNLVFPFYLAAGSQ